MRLHRFYVVQPLGEEVVIEEVSLIHQLTNVFRYIEGDTIILFNGDGNDHHYSLHTVTKRACHLKRVGLLPSYIPSQKITLCLSTIKKDNFELALQKATELGITACIPILSSRSEKKNLSFERLEKIAVEASEQCGRGDVPLISQLHTLKEILGKLTSDDHVLFFDIGGVSIMKEQLLAHNKHIMLFIGPEGGWSEDDVALFTSVGATPYALGNTVLRAETAAIVATALVTI